MKLFFASYGHGTFCDSMFNFNVTTSHDAIEPKIKKITIIIIIINGVGGG